MRGSLSVPWFNRRQNFLCLSRLIHKQEKATGEGPPIVPSDFRHQFYENLTGPLILVYFLERRTVMHE